jgi:hypothetical protein
VTPHHGATDVPPVDQRSTRDRGRRGDHGVGHLRPSMVEGPSEAASPHQAPLEGVSGARSNRSPLEMEFDAEVRDLLLRVTAQERLAEDAHFGLDQFFTWPSWSMDTGLTAAQEKFVEHWTPQRVLDDSRSVRQLVRVLQQWTRTHRDDTDLDEVLTILAALPPR